VNIRLKNTRIPKIAPVMVYTKDFDQTMGFISEDGDL